MKKIALVLVAVLFVGMFTMESLADSATNSGPGWTLNVSINDKILSGSIGGKMSNYGASVTLVGWVNAVNGINTKKVRVPDKSGSPYVSYYISSIRKDANGNGIIPLTWNCGYAATRISGKYFRIRDVFR